MLTTALGKTALSLSALLATGTAATAGLFVTLANAAAAKEDDSAAAASDQLTDPQPSDPTTAGNQRAQDSGARTSPTATSKPRSSFTATPTPQKTSAPVHTKTKGS